MLTIYRRVLDDHLPETFVFRETAYTKRAVRVCVLQETDVSKKYSVWEEDAV